MDRNELARFKRCMEFYCADPAFRTAMDGDPDRAVASLGFHDFPGRIVYDAIRQIVFRDAAGGSAAGNPFVRAVGERQKRIADYYDRFQTPSGYVSQELYSYETVTRERCRTESSLIRQNEYVYYYPFALELSRGCSVQCPFCGFAAGKHEGDFRRTGENAALFRMIIEAAYGRIGPVLGCCPMYFATEPFDNPDYEMFMRDFLDITGNLPQTTTAVAELDPGRLRSWMAFLSERGLSERAALRISVRTLGQFHRIMDVFSPEELEDVELLINNPQSVHRLSASGRVLNGGMNSRQKARYSICCIAGVRVNLVDRAVQFIEPELPDQAHPYGYSVLDERPFSDAVGFARILDDFGRLYVRGRMPTDQPLCFNANIAVSEEPDTWLFLGDGCGYRIARNILTTAAVNGIRSGMGFSGAVSRFVLMREDMDRLYGAFNELFVRGYIRVQ